VVQYQPKTTPTKIPMAFPTRVAVITPTLSPNPERLAAEPLRIEIPKIKATAKIVENVSPYDRGEYLKVLNTNAVAMASGSSRPGNGLGKSTYIFAHSSSQGLQAVRNNPVFYLLGKLRNDDEVTITDGESSYRYKIYDKKIIAADNIEYLSYSDPEREVVILQTCWPIGTDWKRLLVFGERI
jgi:LPXTG-site transpeptidase (sortase) family protein